MTDRRLRATNAPSSPSDAEAEGTGLLRHHHAHPSAMAERLVRAHSSEEAEQRYVTARDEWTAAMRAAGSGKPSDLAALAMAQEAYEVALAERERWASNPTAAIAIEVDRPTGIDVVVGQELSWRRVHEHEHEKEQAKGRRSLLGRLFRR